jgi:hypothetical protein
MVTNDKGIDPQEQHEKTLNFIDNLLFGLSVVIIIGILFLIGI